MENIGGQAVIEGVMMKSSSKVCTVVRVKGKIKIKKQRLKQRNKFWKIPFIRGAVVLYDTLVLGINTLLWSAEQQLGKKEKITKKDIFISMGSAVLLAAALFIVLPYFLASLITETGILFNILDGIIRIILFLIYFIAISFFKDVKRLFQYHGAEHKAINCMEADESLTVKNAARFTTLNPRCGTSFIFIVLLVSIIVFSAIDMGNWFYNIVIRILFVPLIAAVSYEILKFSARYEKKPIIKLIIWPGLLLQKISTKEPDNRQLETAIKALKEVI